jgi:5-methylcytosine-specific restriction endonuclease McrA
VSERRPAGVTWRRKMFSALVARDGAVCAECRAPDRIIWRQMGVWAGDQWGSDPWERFRYTKVHPTSILEVDHKKPLSEGGANDLDNLWLLCGDCHKRKTSSEHSKRLKRLFAEARA